MSNGIKQCHLIKVGHCYHPEFVTRNNWKLKQCQYPATCVLLQHEHYGWILFDTGYDDAFVKETTNFPEKCYAIVTPVKIPNEETLCVQLARYNITPSDINYVILSHFHADHIAGLHRLNNAIILCDQQGYDEITTLSKFKAVRKGILPGLFPANHQNRLQFIQQKAVIELQQSMQPFTSGIDLFGDGSLIAIALPGHARGHFGLLVHRHNHAVFFIADAVWHQETYLQKKYPHCVTHLITDNVKDYKDTINQLNRLATNNPELMIIPSHCGTSFRRFHNEFYE